jgi:membrane-bound metal-dependent hydrolase YbcI (DUF457 family)
MMGGHHAATGAAAWVAVTSTGQYTLGWYPLDATGILIGALATAGAALICDWDHRSSTIANALPPLSNAIAVGIENISGGHRQGTHSLLGAAAFVALAVLAGNVQVQTPAGGLALGAGLLCMFLVNLAAKALKLFPRNGFVSNWLFGLAVAGLVAWFAPENWTWLPLAMGIGVVVHILGDMITTGGVPLLWPLRLKPPRFWRRIPILKNIWRASGCFSLPILGRAGSRREWFLLIPVSGYAMVGMGVAAWQLLAGSVAPAFLAAIR